MKHFGKRLAALGAAALLAVTMGVTASARGHHGGGYQDNLQAAANVVGESVEVLLNQVKEYSCVGELIKELGLQEEFHEEKLNLYEERLNDCVENGTLTRERADAALEAMRERQKNCDGTGNGRGNGVCDGTGNGQGNGMCDGTGNGRGNGVCDGTGNGQGNGVCDGTGNGQGNGVCDGTGNGQGNGICDGTGNGQGNGVCDGTGNGRGNGMRDGTGNGQGRGRHCS